MSREFEIRYPIRFCLRLEVWSLLMVMFAALWPNQTLAQSSPTTPAAMLSFMQQHSQGHPDWAQCQTGNSVACFRFVWSAVQAANLGCDPASWGLLSKQAGEHQCTQQVCGNLSGEGFGEDAITWQAAPGAETVYDTIQGAGAPNPQIQMVEVPRRPNNRWACPWPGQGVPPQIAPVTPNPQNFYAGQPYTKQLVLSQGTAPITWTVLQGPAGTQVTSGLVSGWTPSTAQAGNLHTIQIRAANTKGNHSVTWQVRVTWTGDSNFDYDVDQDDFGVFQLCFSGAGIPHPSGCDWADLDEDGDVDAGDFTLFQICMKGPNQTPGC
jgi:hypothetical protein